MTFADWVQTDAEKLVRVNLTAHNGTSEVNRYIATRHYYDAVNDNEYLDRLIDPLIIRRSINWAGGSAEADVGAISIDNSDRELDDWIDWAWHGWEVEILLGDPTWAADDSRWSTRFKGLADKMEAEDFILTLFVRDKSEKLDRRVVERPLNMHPQAFLRPFPLALGYPQNVTPPLTFTSGGDNNPVYVINAWPVVENSSSGEAFQEVYENGAPTGKSLVSLATIGADVSTARVGFVFDVNDPEGTVTCDPTSAKDDPSSGQGNDLEKAGVIMNYLLPYEMRRESGIALGGSTTTIKLDGNAVHQDDYYTAQNPPVANGLEQGYVAVFRRGANETDNDEVASQSGDTITLNSALSFAVVAGDRYDIVPPDDARYGPLTSAEVDTTAFTAVDSAAGYLLGIWDGGGELTYIDLLNTIFPGGFFYFWKSDGTITAGLLEDPSAGTSVFTIDQYETRGKMRLIQEDAPIYRARVGYSRNYTVMNSADDTVSVSRALFLSREYLWELDEDLTIRDEYPESISQDFPSYILDRADAQTEAQRLMTLFGVARKRIMVEGLSGLFSVDLHDVVTLKDDTYGLENGQDFRVVMMEERPIQGTIDVELWG